MTTIDSALLIFIGLLAIFGFIRGVVSQAMGIAGLVAAYFFAAPLSVHIVGKIAQGMGSTEAYAKPFAVLWSAVLIYIGCRLVGFAIEKIFVNQSGSLKGLNRIGGGFLGAIKGCMILMIAFYILRLVPKETLEAHAPKIPQSKMYQYFANTQLFNPKYIETLAEPIKTQADEILRPKLQTPDELVQSIMNAKNKKAVEKTESKMNNEELNKVLMKHEPKKQTVKK